MTTMTVEVAAGSHDRRWCPVSVRVEEFSQDAAKGIVAEDETGLAYPVQAQVNEDGSAELTWILPLVEAGTKKRFTLRAGDVPEGVQVQDRPGEAVDIRVGGSLFTSYRYERRWPRPFLYPVIGPGDASVTRHFPIRDDVQGEKHDHPHHRSIFFTHGDVNGVNNWSDQEGHGFTRHVRFNKLEGGAVYGDVHSTSLWTDKDEQPIVETDLALRIYALPVQRRIFDVTLTFRAVHGDVVFGDTKEGGLLAVRVASSMDASGVGRIETSTGSIGEQESWGRPASWCHYSGPVHSEYGPLIAGIGLIDHPSNPRYPTHWHVRNYGLMTANPFGLSDFYKDKSRDGSWRLAAGATATFRYRVVIHEGDAGQGEMSGHFANFAYPPTVSVVE